MKAYQFSRVLTAVLAVPVLWLSIPAVSAGDAASGPDRPVVLIQSDYCTNWYNNLQAELSSYQSQCSGELSQSQYDYCQSWAEQLNSQVASYNNQCGG